MQRRREIVLWIEECLFSPSEDQVFKIEIDLRKEMPLRSDLKPTGRLKVPYNFSGGLFRHL